MKDDKQKVVLKKFWTEDIPLNQHHKTNVLRTRVPLLDEFADMNRISEGLIEKVSKGNAIKDISKRGESYRKIRFEIKEQLTNINSLSPLLSKDNQQRIQAVFNHFIQYLDQQIKNIQEYVDQHPINSNQPSTKSKVENEPKIEVEDIFSQLKELVKNEIALQSSQLTKSVSEHLKIKDVAVLFKISKVTVNAWMKSGKLPFYRIGRRVFFKREDLDMLLNHSVKPLTKLNK